MTPVEDIAALVGHDDLVERYARACCDIIDLPADEPIHNYTNFGSDEHSWKIFAYSLRRFAGELAAARAIQSMEGEG